MKLTIKELRESIREAIGIDDDDLVTEDEMIAALNDVRFIDRDDWRTAEQFEEFLGEKFGERESSPEAQEVLYRVYPKIMRRLEDGDRRKRPNEGTEERRRPSIFDGGLFDLD